VETYTPSIYLVRFLVNSTLRNKRHVRHVNLVYFFIIPPYVINAMYVMFSSMYVITVCLLFLFSHVIHLTAVVLDNFSITNKRQP
jgi:hypothetical protein